MKITAWLLVVTALAVIGSLGGLLLTGADRTAQELLEDPEIRLGRDLVLWAPAPTREKILASLDEFVDSQAATEQGSIRASLTSRGIDWTAGPKPAAGTAPLLRMSLKTDRPNNTIPAGEKGTVIATVTNITFSVVVTVTVFTVTVIANTSTCHHQSYHDHPVTFIATLPMIACNAAHCNS